MNDPTKKQGNDADKSQVQRDPAPRESGSNPGAAKQPRQPLEFPRQPDAPTHDEPQAQGKQSEPKGK